MSPSNSYDTAHFHTKGNVGVTQMQFSKDGAGF